MYHFPSFPLKILILAFMLRSLHTITDWNTWDNHSSSEFYSKLKIHARYSVYSPAVDGFMIEQRKIEKKMNTIIAITHCMESWKHWRESAVALDFFKFYIDFLFINILPLSRTITVTCGFENQFHRFWWTDTTFGFWIWDGFEETSASYRKSPSCSPFPSPRTSATAAKASRTMTSSKRPRSPMPIISS